MESPVRSVGGADNTIVASFADITTDSFMALVAANPDIHYRFNAAGDVIQMSPTFIHAAVQGAIVTHFNIWLWQGALPGFQAGTEPTYDLGDWRCQPDVAIDLRAARSSRRKPRSSPWKCAVTATPGPSCERRQGAIWHTVRRWCGWLTRMSARLRFTARVSRHKPCATMTSSRAARCCPASA